MNDRVAHIIKKSGEIIDKSKKLETKLSRLDVIEKILNKNVRPLEEEGIPVFNQPASQLPAKISSVGAMK